MLTRSHIEAVVRATLDEDAPWGDLTSETLIPADATATADLRAREDGVFSGGEVFAAAFALTDPRIEVDLLRRDGDAFGAGSAPSKASAFANLSAADDAGEKPKATSLLG